MSNEPTEQDVKELAALCLASLHDTEHGWRYRPREAAERILASDWYAARIAEARATGTAKALASAHTKPTVRARVRDALRGDA